MLYLLERNLSLSRRLRSLSPPARTITSFVSTGANSWTLRLAEGLVEGVAGAANGTDWIALAPPRQRLAQPPDMNVDRALVDLRGLPPDAIEQLRAREYAPRLFQKIFQETELRRTEMDVAGAAPHPAGFAIEVEVAGIEAIGDALRTAAAQKRPNTRHQLRNRERLDHIIVGADRKAAHALGLLAARGHHDDRERARSLARPKPSADLEARHAGQHPVEDDKVGRALRKTEFGFVAPLHALDDITLRFQIVGEQQGQIRFILDDEDARRRGGVGTRNLFARLVHRSPPAASMSMSISERPRGRSVGIGLPVTR